MQSPRNPNHLEPIREEDKEDATVDQSEISPSLS